ncbi:MAG: DUF4445 domain-containing protein [Clostridiales bacterium]|nr:DUF4445 domain-containing protein [Clostridiales bacterium]
MRIISGGKGIDIPFTRRVLLSELLTQAGIPFDSPCGGKGICGKCTVEASGSLEPRPQNGRCLACRTWATGDDVTVRIGAGSDVIGITESSVSLKGGTGLPLTGDEVCSGLAVDIGTTTVAGYLYALPEGKLLGSLCLPNPQAQYGADVISRIEYASSGGLKQLTRMIRDTVADLCKELGAVNCRRRVLVGNTVMLHLYAGLDPTGISRAPFTPVSLFGSSFNGADETLVRCISSYLGADTVAAVLASGMAEREETALLIDIGTNGEMVLSHNGLLIGCSTAAGPAFEGAQISQGMRYAPGAIDRVSVSEGRAVYTTVGDKKAVGICGSGLINAAACMLALGVMDETGYIEESWEISDSGVFITAGDVRKLQTAKAAIRAGVDVILDRTGISVDEIDTLYLAGGFGSFADMGSCSAIGMIPAELVPRVKVLGNAAGAGASMILLDQRNLERTEEIANRCEVLELSGDSGFADAFIERMMFEE